MSKLLPMKLGIVGQPASGKDTVAAYLVDRYGFIHFSSGDYFRQYVRDNNLGEPTRPLLHEVANKVRAEYGADHVMKVALEKPTDYLVVSGTRSVADVETLKKAGGKIICIDVPLEKRYERVVARERAGDKVSFEEFKRQQEREHAHPSPHGQNMAKVTEMADYVIENDGGLEDLQKKIDNLLIQISKDIS